MEISSLSLSGVHLLLQLRQHLKSKIFVISQPLTFTAFGFAGRLKNQPNKQKETTNQKKKEVVVRVLKINYTLSFWDGASEIPSLSSPQLAPVGRDTPWPEEQAGDHRCSAVMGPQELSVNASFKGHQPCIPT